MLGNGQDQGLHTSADANQGDKDGSQEAPCVTHVASREYLTRAAARNCSCRFIIGRRERRSASVSGERRGKSTDPVIRQNIATSYLVYFDDSQCLA